MTIRIGFGFDVHKLVEGRDLWMGGIKIEHSLGLLDTAMPMCCFMPSATLCLALPICVT